MISVVIVDDQELIRTGFELILGSEPDIDVVATSSDGLDALEDIDRWRPDVVLMDIRMPRLDGIETTKQLHDRMGDEAPQVLILTTFDLDEYVYEALRAGAAGFLLKDTPPEALIEGVRTVAAGDALLAPSITRRLISQFAEGTTTTTRDVPELADLTDRENEVLLCVARGLSNAEIGSELFVSETTVKTHVSRMLAKLGVRDRVQAVVLAYESGLVTPGI